MNDEHDTRFCLAAHRQIQRAARELTREHVRGAIEAVLLAAPEPLTLRDLTRATRAKRAVVRELLDDLIGEYGPRGIHIRETSRGFRLVTNPRFTPEVRHITGRRPIRMTRAQLEAMSIIAYRQPVTRPEIDDVRGVDSGPVLRTLLDRELIRVIGKKEEPGRPLLYGTTDTFLDLLGLKSLADLPTLREFTELSDASRDTYERRLGESAPAGTISFDDEPDAPIDPRQPTEDEPQSDGGGDGDGADEEQDHAIDDEQDLDAHEDELAEDEDEDLDEDEDEDLDEDEDEHEDLDEDEDEDEHEDEDEGLDEDEDEHEDLDEADEI